MIRSALGVSPLEENLRYLTDSIGGRVTGTAAADRAIGWSVEAFRRAGVDEVHTEKFSIPSGWSEGATKAEVIAPETFALHLVSHGWSPPASPGGITADVVDVGLGDDAGFAAAGSTVDGAFVLVHSEPLNSADELLKEETARARIVNQAMRSGAAAIFWMSSRRNLLLYRQTGTQTGELEPLPEATIAREDAQRMARFLASGQKVRVHFEMPNHVSGPVETENVVAEIRGREKPEDFVALSANLDSWDLGTGGLDDGCHAAMVIDAARVIRASGTIPRRSIRFILFTGNQQGMLGVRAYVQMHNRELDHMVADIAFPSGIGRVERYSVGGRKDLLATLPGILEPIQPLGLKNFEAELPNSNQNLDFLLEGIPTLIAEGETSDSISDLDAASDTFDKVDMNELRREVALSAVTAYALADSDERVGPRQSGAQVQELLRETGLDKRMQLEGLLAARQNKSGELQP